MVAGGVHLRPEDVVYVVHARPLTEHEKHRAEGGSDEESCKTAGKKSRETTGIQAPQSRTGK